MKSKKFALLLAMVMLVIAVYLPVNADTQKAVLAQENKNVKNEISVNGVNFAATIKDGDDSYRFFLVHGGGGDDSTVWADFQNQLKYWNCAYTRRGLPGSELPPAEWLAKLPDMKTRYYTIDTHSTDLGNIISKFGKKNKNVVVCHSVGVMAALDAVLKGADIDYLILIDPTVNHFSKISELGDKSLMDVLWTFPIPFAGDQIPFNHVFGLQFCNVEGMTGIQSFKEDCQLLQQDIDKWDSQVGKPKVLMISQIGNYKNPSDDQYLYGGGVLQKQMADKLGAEFVLAPADCTHYVFADAPEFVLNQIDKFLAK